MSDMDETDLADLKREAVAQRKTARAYCPECRCVGHHAFGCLETPEDEDDETEGDE